MRRQLLLTVPVALSALVVGPVPPAGAAPSGEDGYYAGSVVFFTAGATHVDAPQNEVENANPLFLLGFPVPAGTDHPVTLPSGYQPQENGNFHVPVPFHDHVLVAVPGDPAYKAPLRVVVLRYTTAYAYSPDFRPVTSAEGIAAGERAGLFQPIDPTAANPYEHWTSDVLVRPVVDR